MSKYNNYTKEYCYYLGYLWSDGYVSKYKIELEIIKSDGDDISPILLNISNDIKFKVSTRQRINRKEQLSFNIYSHEFSSHLVEYHYDKKSYSNFYKILNRIKIIDENLIRYFILGLIDGDGCFYLSKDKISKQFYITSSFDQDWSSIIEVINSIGITRIKINKSIQKNGNKSSYIRITNYLDIKKLYEYLYPNGFEFGLTRKYNKCKEIIDNIPKTTYNPLSFTIEDLVKRFSKKIK